MTTKNDQTEITKAAQVKAEEASAAFEAAKERHAKALQDHAELRAKAGKVGTKVTARHLADSSGAVELAEAQVRAYGEEWNAAFQELTAAVDDALAAAVREELPGRDAAILARVDALARHSRDELAVISGMIDERNDVFLKQVDMVKEPGTMGRNRQARLALMERGIDISAGTREAHLIIDGEDFSEMPKFSAEDISMEVLHLRIEEERAAESAAEALADTAAGAAYPILLPPETGDGRRIDHAA